MMVRYWQPFREIDVLRRQIDDIFGELTDMTTAVKAAWTPAVRLVDEGDNYVLHLQLAGVRPEDLDIQATREAVVIVGERKAAEVTDGHKLLFDDLRYGSFRRAIALPEAIQNDHVQATFAEGLLTLTLPKVVEARNKVVKVSLGELKAVETAAIVPAEAAPAALSNADHADTSDVWAGSEG